MTTKTLKLTDQVIGQIREMLQLSLLSGTNIVDHLRTLELEENSESSGSLILSEAYCVGWNQMVISLQEQAKKKEAEMSTTIATDGDSAAEDKN